MRGRISHKKFIGATIMDSVQIQLQDITGIWRTMSSVINNSQIIISAMKSLKERFPDKRVRAVDENGRLLDLLG